MQFITPQLIAVGSQSGVQSSLETSREPIATCGIAHYNPFQKISLVGDIKE